MSDQVIPFIGNGAEREKKFSFLSTVFPCSARDRLIHGIGWNTAGTAVAQGSSFLSSIILARVFGKASFGQFALIQSMVVALTCVAGLGLGVTATKYVSEFRSKDPERAGQILGLASLVALAAALLFSIALEVAAPYLAVGKDGTGILTYGLRLSVVYVFFIILNGYQIGALAGFESFRALTRVNIIYGLSSLFMTWGLALVGGLRGAVVAQGLSTAVLWLLCHRAVAKECRASDIKINYQQAWRQHSILMRFSLPAAVSGMIASLAMWWCSVALVTSGGYSELAIFTAVNNMRLMVLFIPALITRVTAPLMNGMLAGGDIVGYRRTFWGSLAMNGTVALFIAAALALIGQHVLRLFGKEFTGAQPVVLLLLASAVVEVVATSLYQAIFSSGTLWRHFKIISVWTLILVWGTHLASPRYGAAGLAGTYLIAWCISLVLYALVATGFKHQVERHV